MPVALVPAAPLLALDEPEPEVPVPEPEPEELEPELAAGLAAELELPLPLSSLEPELVDLLPPAAVVLEPLLPPLPVAVAQGSEPSPPLPVMPAAAELGHLARAELHSLLWAPYHELMALS